jgi:hypothetical protein
VANRYLATLHKPTVGFAAPMIYQIANTAPASFHDVTTGSNGYPAGPAWDEATGWGSIDWWLFAQSLRTSCLPLETEVGDLEARIQDLSDAIASGEIPIKYVPGVRAEISHLQAELHALRKQLQSCLKGA